MNVSNKIAIITGSGRGLGKSIALKLAEFGADIVVCDIDIDSANTVAEEIKKQERLNRIKWTKK